MTYANSHSFVRQLSARKKITLTVVDAIHFRNVPIAREGYQKRDFEYLHLSSFLLSSLGTSLEPKELGNVQQRGRTELNAFEWRLFLLDRARKGKTGTLLGERLDI